MTEYPNPIPQEFSALLTSKGTEPLPQEGIIYTSEQSDSVVSRLGEQPLQILVSPEGIRLQHEFPALLDLLHRPLSSRRYSYEVGWGGKVTKQQVGKFLHSSSLAVKEIDPTSFDITMLEQFNATRLLLSEGVRCAIPLLATRWRLISQWIEGKTAEAARNEDFMQYITTVENIFMRCKEQGLVDKNWKIDNGRSNYIINTTKSNNILDRFISIDPVYKRSGTFD